MLMMFEEKIVWHEVTTRKLTDEEKAEYAERGYADYEVPESTFDRTPIMGYSPRSAASADYCSWVSEYLHEEVRNGRCENPDCEYHWHPLDEEDDNEQ